MVHNFDMASPRVSRALRELWFDQITRGEDVLVLYSPRNNGNTRIALAVTRGTD